MSESSSFVAAKAPWLSLLPADRPAKPLRFMLERNDGGAWGQDPTGDGDVIVLRSTEQTVDGRWCIEQPAFRSLKTAEHEATCLKFGDLLVTKSSGSATHIGKTTLVDSDVASLKAGYSNFMQRLRVTEDHDPKYVWYLLNSDQAKVQINLESTTSTGLANLNGGLLGRLVFPAPAQVLQSAIASYLDAETTRIDGLIQEKENLGRLLAELRNSVVSEAIERGLDSRVELLASGVPWVGPLPCHWKPKRLKHLLDGIEQGWSPQCDGRPAELHEWGVLKAGACNGGKFRVEEQKALC